MKLTCVTLPSITLSKLRVSCASISSHGTQIKVPDAIYLSGPSTIFEGESAQFTAVVICENPGTTKFVITDGSRSGVELDATSGLLSSTENGVSDSTLTIQAIHTPKKGAVLQATATLTIKQRIYPTSITIEGEANPSGESTAYKWASSVNVTGDMIAEWSLTGDITNYRQIQTSDTQTCILSAIGSLTSFADSAVGELSLTLKKRVDNSIVASATKRLLLLDPNVIMTSDTNPEVMEIMYNNGLAANAEYMTRDEAELVTANDIKSGTNSIFYNTKIKTFDEFKYFINVTSISGSMFNYCNKLTSIIIPDSATSIGNDAFNACSSLKSVSIGNSVTSIGNFVFNYCSSLTSITIPDSVTSIGTYTFNACTSLKEITCRAKTAPSVKVSTFGDADNSYTGRNTYDTGENKLYVPTTATGYDSSYWASVLCDATKCGFSVVHTLI